jgi:cellulose synthase/poly-beta-1,6-N-acetylglucosamine synthase-like glycosyltransferase
VITPARVSVVIPVGGVDDDLNLQLEALAHQSFANGWELELSLNTDDPEARRQLEAAAARYQRRETGDGEGAAEEIYRWKIVDSSAVRSASHARNVGAEAAGGDVLLFCDGDDIADQDWMAELVNALEEHRVVGGHLEEDLLSVPGQEDWRPPATPGGLPAFLGHPYLVTANMGIWREEFQAVGGFDVSLIRGEDIALSWDLIERDLAPVYCPTAIVHYRHRKGLWPMMKQHYLYGRGFSQILTRRGVPGQDGMGSLRAMKPNGQPVANKNLVYFARRGSIAVGRVVGLAVERSQT